MFKKIRIYHLFEEEIIRKGIGPVLLPPALETKEPALFMVDLVIY